MSQSTVRCRCGHQVLGREVLRTEPYEKASGREVIYVKYRCRRCKALGESFIPQEEWDWSIFETPRNEMGALERDRFLDQNTISSGDVISFHRALQKAQTLGDLNRSETRRKEKRADKREGDKRESDKPTPDKSPGSRPSGG